MTLEIGVGRRLTLEEGASEKIWDSGHLKPKFDPSPSWDKPLERYY